jgi:hypothetical protein
MAVEITDEIQAAIDAATNGLRDEVNNLAQSGSLQPIFNPTYLDEGLDRFIADNGSWNTASYDRGALDAKIEEVSSLPASDRQGAMEAYLKENNIPLYKQESTGAIYKLNIPYAESGGSTDPKYAEFEQLANSAYKVTDIGESAGAAYTRPLAPIMGGDMIPSWAIAIGSAINPFLGAGMSAMNTYQQGGSFGDTLLAGGTQFVTGGGVGEMFPESGFLQTAETAYSVTDPFLTQTQDEVDQQVFDEEFSLGTPDPVNSDDLFYDDGLSVRPDWTYGTDVLQSVGQGGGTIYTRDPVTEDSGGGGGGGAQAATDAAIQAAIDAASSSSNPVLVDESIVDDIFGSNSSILIGQLEEALAAETNPVVAAGLEQTLGDMRDGASPDIEPSNVPTNPIENQATVDEEGVDDDELSLLPIFGNTGLEAEVPTGPTEAEIQAEAEAIRVEEAREAQVIADAVEAEAERQEAIRIQEAAIARENQLTGMANELSYLGENLGSGLNIGTGQTDSGNGGSGNGTGGFGNGSGLGAGTGQGGLMQQAKQLANKGNERGSVLGRDFNTLMARPAGMFDITWR